MEGQGRGFWLENSYGGRQIPTSANGSVLRNRVTRNGVGFGDSDAVIQQ
jgi:hypothetical protein